MGFTGSSDGKESACNVRDLGSIPGSGGSPGEGNGNPLQYSCLENPTDRRPWWPTVHGDSDGKESACNAGDLGLTPGSGRSPGEQKGYPLQYSGLESSMDCIVHGVTKDSDTTERLSLTHSLTHMAISSPRLIKNQIT